MSSHALKIIRLPKGFRARSAASTAMLLILGLVMAGCRSSGPDPNAFNTPPLTASALSGGKITHFISTPGLPDRLPDSSTDKDMLLACQQLPITSSTARSAILVVNAGQFGRVPLHALVVGKQVLMLPTDLARMGITFSGDNHNHSFILYPTSSQRITFVPDSMEAYVGSKTIALKVPVVEIQRDKQLVMLLSDLLTVFRERDRQRHQPPFFRNVQIIYDIQDYHR